MNKLLIVLYLFISHISFGQIADSFTTTNLNSWTGDTSKFQIQNQQLQSNSLIPNDLFYIARPCNFGIQEWQLDLNLLFNTSSVNYVDFVLFSNNSNLLNADSTLYVRVGNTKDEISLYQKMGSNTQLLIDGLDGVTNKSRSELILKVRRLEDSLYLNFSNSWTAPLVFKIPTSSPVDTLSIRYQNAFCGLIIKQSTASFFQDHYFNYFYAGDLIKDTIPPQIKALSVLDSNQLGISFTKPIQNQLLTKLGNYQVESINPNNIERISEDSIVLTFPNTFPSGLKRVLRIDSLMDLVGNLTTSQSIDFEYRYIRFAQHGDILISEVFAKPASSGLSVEAYEIYTVTQDFLDIGSLKMLDFTSDERFPNQILQPNSYYVVCDDQDSALFQNTISLRTMPTLNDDSDLIRIEDDSGSIIANLQYFSSWHKSGKENGFWSLEMKDINKGCHISSNFSSSIHPNGHTLGTVNSINEALPQSPNFLERHYSNNPRILSLYFSDAVEPQLYKDPNLYQLDPDIGVDSIRIARDNSNQLILYFNQDIKAQQKITLLSHTQCNGFNMTAQTIEWEVSKIPQVNNLQITEVMFNALTNCSEYVEILNVSRNYINLKNNFLGHASSSKNVQFVLTEEEFMLAPNQLAVLVQNKEEFNSCYTICPDALIIEVKDWTSLSDEGGSIWLRNGQNQIIDTILYHKDYHSTLLNDEDGVALEKIDSAQSGLNRTVWSSVGSDQNYASPGCNSNFHKSLSSNQPFSLASPYFGLGINGSANIQYQLPKPNYQLSIEIVDKRGVRVMQLVNNQVVSQKGSYFWDGTDNEGRDVALGIYFIRIQAIHSDGNIENATLELTKLK